MNAIKLLFTISVTIAGIGFVYGIFKACFISWRQDPDVSKMPVFLINVVLSIAAILATNFGAVVGLGFKDTQSGFRNIANWNPLNIFSGDSPTVLQTFACYLYLFGLIASAIVWARKNFTDNEKQIVSLLPQLTKSLLGIIVGALAVALGVSDSST